MIAFFRKKSLLFQVIKEYTSDNPKGYWFKRKLFGWGWVPVKWQGWLVTALYLSVVLLATPLTMGDPTFWRIFAFTAVMVISTFILIRVAYKMGEKPKWQWGFKK